ncbi:MAG: hypothetical protein ACQEVA_12290 [Myxococcota bacterium]
MSEEHDHHDITPPKELELGKNFYSVAIALTVIGLLAFVGGLFGGMEDRAWQGYLMGWWMLLSFALCGPFFNATQYLTSGGWSVSMRRIAEAFGTAIVPSAILGLIILFGGGADELFVWLNLDQLHGAYRELIEKKTGFLNRSSLIGWTLASFAAWTLFAWLMRKTSVTQDETGEAELFERNKKLSVGFLFVFVIGFSTMSWLWLMSLEPAWFSTMWQVYLFAALFQTGLALMTIIALGMRDRDYFGDFMNDKQIHAMGKLVFAFTVFYAYIAFSQFLLIWYANIPEEAFWFVNRIDEVGGWHWFIALFALKFIIPFFALLPQANKKNKYNVLRYVCYGLIVAFAYEMWFIVGFTSHHHEVHLHTPWLELLIIVGFAGVLMLSVGRALASENLVPVNDPFLHESLDIHHHGHLPESVEQDEEYAENVELPDEDRD